MNIKFLLDDFEVIGSVEKSIEALKVKLFEPHSVGEKKISYIVFTGDAVELNKQFHYYDTSEKSKLLGKKISFNLKINPPSEQFYNYNEEIGSSNPWANRSWIVVGGKASLRRGIVGDIEKDCLLLSAFNSEEEKDDISNFQISNDDNDLTREKKYLISLTKENPTSEEEIEELKEKVRIFSEGARINKNKKWAWDHFSRGNFSNGKEWEDIVEEWEERIYSGETSDSRLVREDFDTSLLTGEKAKRKTKTKNEQQRKQDENTENNTPTTGFSNQKVILVVILIAVILVFLGIFLIWKNSQKKKKISKSDRDKHGMRSPLDKKDTY